MREIRLWAFQGLLLLFAARAFCGDVDPRTGNYSFESQDLQAGGQGLPLEVDRVYNSASGHLGAFGRGWSSNFETYLEAFPDGTAILHEWGGGATSVFAVADPKQAQSSLDQAIETIVKASQKRMRIIGSASLNLYRQRLRRDAAFRRSEWNELRRVHGVTAVSVPEGTLWQSSSFGSESLVRTRMGFRRTRSDGRTEEFDVRGHLVRIEDRNRNWIALRYNEAGRLLSLVDSFGRALRLDWNGMQRISSMTLSNGDRVTYRYSPTGELIESEAPPANHQTYAWDGSHRSLLVRVSGRLGDEEIHYYGRDKNEAVQSFRDLIGRTHHFSYDWKNGQIRWTSELMTDSSGKVILRKASRFLYSPTKDGETTLTQLSELIDGQQSATDYGGCCGLPIRIQSGSRTITQEFSPTGLLIRRKTPDGQIDYQRDPKTGAPLKVVKGDKGSSSEITTYAYDDAGNLLGVHAGTFIVTLARDRFGRITALSDSQKHRYDLKYNEHSYLDEIHGPDGTIEIFYRKYGHPFGLKASSTKDLSVLLEILIKLRNTAPDAGLGPLLDEVERLTHLKTFASQPVRSN